MRLSANLASIAAIAATVNAAPAAGVAATSPNGKITTPAQLNSAISNLENSGKTGTDGAAAAIALLKSIVPYGKKPKTFEGLMQALKTQVIQPKPFDIFVYGARIIANSLSTGDLETIAAGYSEESSSNNSNTKEPSSPVYPKASANDAPYSVSEDKLRAAIYIPPTFKYGAGKEPVLFLPGTAAVAGQQNAANFGKLFVQNDVADPVYVNIPNKNLADIQIAAEYTAYAINYISGISNNVNVSTLSWSAGSLDGQWAFKYWPSTRSHVSDAIRISADLHGTTEAQSLCPGFITPGCTPAIKQQEYNSTFIETLRTRGGADAYVPTTTVYSRFDEIVEPQSDPNASAFTGDSRGVGSTNVELQNVCSTLTPGGGIQNDHEGVLVNALAYALAVDALTHDGPGELSRINVVVECQKFAPDGLSVEDVLATYALDVDAVVNILEYEPKVTSEPAIMAYAQKDAPA